MTGPQHCRSLADWLSWQESLNPAEIDLGLERVAEVASRLGLQPPSDRVFTVAGTNGKGSTVAALQTMLQAAGSRTGVYTSPHLVRYNERIVVDQKPMSDRDIVAAFERVEAARQGIPLTYFEFGTLAAFSCFSEANCDAWVLEVGLGGRLDAVNIIDPDFALITTVDLDHQAWLGGDIETIAAEKAGIMRSGAPAFYGDTAVPEAVRNRAAELVTELHTAGSAFTAERSADSWVWCGRTRQLDGLTIPAGGDKQIANQALALAALEACEPELLAPLANAPALLAESLPPGRCQRVTDTHQWLLDVGHNPQAGRALASILREYQPATIVLGMLADKHAQGFVEALGINPRHWLLCPSQGMRAVSATDLAAVLAVPEGGEVRCYNSADEALEAARALTPAGGNIFVCGSFSVVGPALQWLGLYSRDTG